jgi:hypothetical protein
MKVALQFRMRPLSVDMLVCRLFPLLLAVSSTASAAAAAGVVLRRFSRLVQGTVLVRDLASLAYDGVPEAFDAAG